MAYPVSGSPWSGTAPATAYSGTFIPEIWSGKLIEKFYDATVLAAIANTDYQGEISNQGDKVIIRTRPSITINTYEAEQALTVERPSAPTVELLIDQGRYFNTVLDDVMAIQSDLDMMSMWADDASEQMKINIDTYILDNLVADVLASSIAAEMSGASAGRISGNINLGATTSPVSLSTSNILDFIIDCGTVLDEQNVPENGRWIVIPSWMAALVKKSDLKDASLSGDGTSMLRNGRLGMIDRFTLYMSNHTPEGTSVSLEAGEYGILFGHSQGTTFASQLTKMETLRAESTFGTLMRGLQVFGYKLVDPTLVGLGVVDKA